ncbi:UNVERIFIED_CONTAM: hypothetical protein Slati_4551900 [Sesamum latifolium]|uniref:Uncharacterized protein n=1 Tax=Sesamum latifolium TaxID=2727402 RepID=A0AAW2S2G0_9LAMI
MRYPDLESLEFALLAFPHRPNCFPWTATELHRLLLLSSLPLLSVERLRNLDLLSTKFVHLKTSAH